MDFYFDCYGGIDLQRFMVSDRPRTDAFAHAIVEAIEGGERVLDVGTGTGLLAMLCAKAGAAKVYALDQATIAEVAKALVDHNGLQKTIEVVNANATGFQLAEPVDLLVSEWLGHFGFVENMLDDVIEARDANLKPGGTMLPCGIEVYLAPVCSPALYEEEGPGYWRNPVHGIDFTPLEKLELQQAIAIKTNVRPDELMAPGKPIVSLDLATAQKEDPFQKGTVSFTINRTDRFDGLCGWFYTQLSKSIGLDTSPHAPHTHWSQVFFPFEPIEMAEGETLEVGYELKRHPYDKRSVALEISINGKTIEYTVG